MNRLTSRMMAFLLCLVGLLFLQPLMQTMGLGSAKAAADDESATDVLTVQTEVADPTADSDAPIVNGDQTSESASDEPVVQDELSDAEVAEPAAASEAAESEDTAPAAGGQFRRGGGRSAPGGGLRSGGRARRPGPGGMGLFGGMVGRGTVRPEGAPADSGTEGVWTRDIGVTWSEERDALYGFSTQTGTWSTLKITPQETIVPVVGNSLAVVSLGNQLAAFSGTVCSWDVLELDDETDAVPTVHAQHITLRTDKHLYTFAEGLGKWTSPTDPALSAPMSDIHSFPGPVQESETVLEVDAEAPLSVEVEEDRSAAPMVRLGRTDVLMLGTGSADLARQSQLAERESIETAKKLQPLLSRLGNNHPEIRQLTSQLRDAVTRAYTARNEQQKRRMTALEDRLAKIRDSLEARSKLQDRIIERRVEELLDPNVDWQSLSSSTLAAPKRGLRAGVSLGGPPHLFRLPTPNPPRVENAGGLSAPAEPIDAPASAKEMFEVPDLIGMSQKHAVILLHELGLKNSKINIDRDANSRGPVEAHRVLTQQPEPGTQIDTETTVTISLGTRRRSDTEESWTWDSPGGRNTEKSSNPGRSAGIASAASVPRPFDWDEVERLRVRLEEESKEAAQDKANLERLMTVVAEMHIPWGDATEDQRLAAASAIVSSISLRGGGRRGSRYGVTRDEDDDDDNRRDPVGELISDEKRYEMLRTSSLEALERQLKRLDQRIRDLERPWAQYQAMIEDQELNVRQAVLEQRVASEKFDTVMQAAENGAFTRTQVSDYKLAMDKAQINQERAESYLDRIRQIGKDYPQFDPEPYRTFLQEATNRLATLQSQPESDTPPDDNLNSF